MSEAFLDSDNNRLYKVENTVSCLIILKSNRFIVDLPSESITRYEVEKPRDNRSVSIDKIRVTTLRYDYLVEINIEDFRKYYLKTMRWYQQ